MTADGQSETGPARGRPRAAALFARGMTRAEVARAVGVCRATATRWHRLWEAGGARALSEPGRRGRAPKVGAGDLDQVQRALAGPPRAGGFDLERWSLAAIAALIERSTGVAYHPRHVTRVLRRLGWVLPPVGATAPHAFRECALADPEGNGLLLRERACRADA